MCFVMNNFPGRRCHKGSTKWNLKQIEIDPISVVRTFRRRSGVMRLATMLGDHACKWAISAVEWLVDEIEACPQLQSEFFLALIEIGYKQ